MWVLEPERKAIHGSSKDSSAAECLWPCPRRPIFFLLTLCLPPSFPSSISTPLRSTSKCFAGFASWGNARWCVHTKWLPPDPNAVKEAWQPHIFWRKKEKKKKKAYILDYCNLLHHSPSKCTEVLQHQMTYTSLSLAKRNMQRHHLKTNLGITNKNI